MGTRPHALPKCWHLPTFRQPLFITERWSRQPFHPCLAFAIVIFQSLVSSLCAENRLAQVLPCNSTHEAAPANDEAQSRSRGAENTTGSAASDFSGSALSLIRDITMKRRRTHCQT